MRSSHEPHSPQNPAASNEQQITITAARSTLVVFSLMTLPFFLLFLWLYAFRRGDLAPVVLTGTLSALAFAWWQRFRVQIDKESIHYRSLFGGTRGMRLADIGKVVQRVDFQTGSLRPPIRLEIASKRDPRTAFDINLKVLSLEDIQRIHAALKPYITPGR